MDAITREEVPLAAAAPATSAAKTTSRRRVAALLGVTLLLLGAGLVPRLESRGALARQTATFSRPTVAVTHPLAGASLQHLDFPANVEAYAETSIYARTDGYLARWYEDIGGHVAAGAPLADIATPEIDAELQQARQLAATARAHYEIAKVTADRWTSLLKTRAVSQQEAEQDVATMKADRAALEAARANVRRLAQLQSYEHVTAPFAGVITARNIDVGALINAGSAGSAGSALFHLVETERLRVFIDVPQEFAAEAGPGTLASLTLPQQPGRAFRGTVARTAGAIDPASRTLRVEVDFDNRDGAIMPGAYGTLDLAIPVPHPRASLPVSALLFRPQGVEVAVVGAGSVVRLLPVTLGRDYGTRIEIASGLTGSEQVIVNPNDGIVAGEGVNVESNPGTRAGKPS
jgi:RND family efflux transporter MFP subunit